MRMKKFASSLSNKALIARLAGVALLLWAGIGGYVYYLNSFKNFHEVVPDELYRSGQMSPETLKDLSEKHGFKTIINLRGNNPGKHWYDGEVMIAQALGIDYIDFGLSAVSAVSPEKYEKLTEVFKSAKKPILVHCKAGSDRAGFASALYLYKVKNEPKDIAAKQLSFTFGHFSLPFLGEYNLDKSFKVLAKTTNPPGEVEDIR